MADSSGRSMSIRRLVSCCAVTVLLTACGITAPSHSHGYADPHSFSDVMLALEVDAPGVDQVQVADSSGFTR